MKEPTTLRSDSGGKRQTKRLRVRRAQKVCAVPGRKRRWLRICGWSAGSVATVAILVVGLLYLLFATGFITVDMARPYVERALEARIGEGRTVAIGGIVADRAGGGGMLLRASDITVRDADGDVIATAPQAEVALQDSWLPWLMQPKRIDLVGVKLNVLIDSQGQLAVSTDGGSTLRASAADAPAPSPAAAPSPATPVASAPAAPSAAPTPVATPFGPLRLTAIAALAAQIDKGGLDGGKLSEIGLKDGIVVIRSDISGRQWTFDDIDLSLSRPAAGGVSFDVKAGGADGPWSARATIGPLTGGQRDLMLEVRDVAPRDLLIAAGKAGSDILATSPLSVDLKARIDRVGTLIATEGRIAAGAGELQVGPDIEGRMLVDEAAVAFSIDPVKRTLNLTSVSAQAGPFGMQLAAIVGIPADATSKWTLTTTSAHASFSGGGAGADKEPPFILDDIAIAMSFDPVAQRFSIDRGDLKGPQGGLTIGGALELGGPEPSLGMSIVTTPVAASVLKRLWPVVAAPDPRHWVYDNLIGGDVSSAQIAFKAPLSSIGKKNFPLPDDAVSINIVGSNGSFTPIPGMPPVTGANVTVKVTGRTAHIVVAKGIIETAGKRKLNVSEGVFDIPDTSLAKPEAKVRVTVDGPAAAAIELSALPALRGSASLPVEPGSVDGSISGTAQISVRLSSHIEPSDVDFAFDADLTNFDAAKVAFGQSLENAKVRVFVTPAATVMRGEGKFGGAPASFEYSKPITGDMTFVLQTTLDDAARQKLGMELAGLSGTVGVKLSGVVGAKAKTADVDIDLTGARLAELVPGWSKPAGKPARLTAKATVTNAGTKLDDLVVSGQGVNIRGTVDLDAKGGLVSANLPTFQLSDGDNASVKVDNSDGVLKITVRGEVIEARAFLKHLLEAPVAGKPNEKPVDIDLDVNLGVVAGNNGETMRQAVLKLSRRGGDLRSFVIAALVGRDGGVNGELVPQGNGRPRLRIATTDAGALLRFVNLYARIYGGDLWIDVDAPRGDGKAQLGTVNMRDFVIRGEPGLDRLIAAAPASSRAGQPAPGTAISFRKLQVEFQRSAEQLTIREGAIWGPTVGSTFDGNLDFAADRIAVRGTYVPAYGLNNLFSRLPVVGFFLGGGQNEGLVGVTYEIVGPLSGPTLRVNPISAIAPGFLRKIFEFRQAPDPTPPAVVPTR